MRCEPDDIIIYYIVGAFALDNMVNYYTPIPVYVASIPVSMLLMFRFTRDKLDRLWFIVCILCLLASALMNFLRFAITIEDVSDILFMAQYFSAFFFAKNARVSPSAISHATYVFALLFLPAFFGINGSDYSDDTDVFTSGSKDIEFLRLYNQGVYRLPHVASYLLAFSSLWWAYISLYSRRMRHVAIALLFLFLTLYTGSRTPVIVMAAAYLVANIRLQARPMLLLASICVLGGFFLIYISEIMDFLFGSFLYQYVSFFDTILNNYDRLSRVIIWNSWLSAITSFNGLDFFIGRNFSSSFDFNMRQIGLYIWFHNDFLSAFYSYGMPVLIAYAVPHAIAIRKAVHCRSSSKALAVLGFFIFSAAFVNGFCKYLPVMFFVLLFSNSADVAAYARGLSSPTGPMQGPDDIDEANRTASAR